MGQDSHPDLSSRFHWHKQVRKHDAVATVGGFKGWKAAGLPISNAIGYAKHFSCPHDAVIRVYNESGNVIETHEHKGDFKEF